MIKYPKINTIYKRSKKGELLLGEYSTEIFKYLSSIPWMWTEKIDGTNFRIIWNAPEDDIHPNWVAVAEGLDYSGKTDKASFSEQQRRGLDDTMEAIYLRLVKSEQLHSSRLVIFGELLGPGIQKDLYKAYTQGTHRIVLYDIWDANKSWYSRSAVEAIADQLGLDVVPIIGYGTLPELTEYVWHNAPPSNFDPDVAIEGIVARSEVPLFEKDGRGHYHQVITKIKVKDFKKVMEA